MANDRLYLVCRLCGDHAMLYKYYPSGGLIQLESIAGPDGGYLGHWIDQHVHTYNSGIPKPHVPELLNESQMNQRWDELQERRRRWDAGDGPADASPRTEMGPQALPEEYRGFALPVLPTVTIPALAFDAATIEAYVILMKTPRQGPVQVTVDWYRDLADQPPDGGHVTWGAVTVAVAPGDALPDHGSHGWYPELIPGSLRGPGAASPPMVVNDPEAATDSLVLDGGPLPDSDLSALVVYRDAVSASDTAIGDAVVTHISVKWG